MWEWMLVTIQGGNEMGKDNKKGSRKGCQGWRKGEKNEYWPREKEGQTILTRSYPNKAASSGENQTKEKKNMRN